MIVIIIEMLLVCVALVLLGGIAGAAKSGDTDSFVKLLTAFVLALGSIGLLLK